MVSILAPPRQQRFDAFLLQAPTNYPCWGTSLSRATLGFLEALVLVLSRCCCEGVLTPYWETGQRIAADMHLKSVSMVALEVPPGSWQHF